MLCNEGESVEDFQKRMTELNQKPMDEEACARLNDANMANYYRNGGQTAVEARKRELRKKAGDAIGQDKAGAFYEEYRKATTFTAGLPAEH